MRFSPDCVRDILFVIEEHEQTHFPSNYPELSAYSDAEILYHVKQCDLSPLIIGYTAYIDGSCAVADLSPQGHDLLAHIRDNTTWKKLKKNIIGSIPTLISLVLALHNG